MIEADDVKNQNGMIFCFENISAPASVKRSYFFALRIYGLEKLIWHGKRISAGHREGVRIFV